MRHESLDPLCLQMIAWLYPVVGRYISQTLEQWELGFMRDQNYGKEVVNWMRIAFAFRTYHRRKKLPLRSKKQETGLIGDFCSISLKKDEKHPERELLRECYFHPDDWEGEAERMQKVKETGTWEPPDHLEWTW